MHKKNLIKIINQELDILSGLVESFAEDRKIHPLEVDMALSKTNDVSLKLNLLKAQLDQDSNDSITNNLVQVEQKASEKTEVQEASIIEKPPVEKTGAIVEPVVEPEQAMTNRNNEFEAPEEIIEKPEEKIEESTNNEPTNNAEVAAVVEEDLVNEEDQSKVEEIVEEIIEHTEEPEPIIEETPEPDTPSEASKPADVQNSKAIFADKFQDHSLSLNETLANLKNNKDLASKLKDRPVTDLKKSIKLNDKIWFINELFGQDTQLYQQTIDKINNAQDLDQALAYLFSNFEWDQEQKSTISFLELVFRRFANQQ